MANKIDSWHKCEITEKEQKMLNDFVEMVFRRSGGRGERSVVSFKGFSGKNPTISFDAKCFEAGNIPAKDREGPEFLAAVKLWAEHIIAGAGKLQDIPHEGLRAAVSRAVARAVAETPAIGWSLPPVKESLPMPPKRMVTEDGPVGTTITRNVKRGNKMQKAG